MIDISHLPEMETGKIGSSPIVTCSKSKSWGSKAILLALQSSLHPWAIQDPKIRSKQKHIQNRQGRTYQNVDYVHLLEKGF
jgi:hypothetical protein